MIFRIRRAGIDLFQPKKILFFLWLFLLVFPKGGIKISDMPITWGYLLLGVTALASLQRKIHTIRFSRLQVLMCLLPFQLISLITIAKNGIGDSPMAISFLISFFFIPYLFLLLIGNEVDEIEIPFLSKLMKIGVLFIAAYGIFLFIYKYKTGSFIEIPFLTVNYGDLGELEGKHINRGNLFKLISTYNNGNIFGVCLLMILPLYCSFEKNHLKKAIVKGSILLCFARTAWIGLIFHELFYDVITQSSNRSLHDTFKKLGASIAKLSLVLLGVAALASTFGLKKSFFFDSNLGGRLEQVEQIQHAEWISSFPFSGIYEIVYLGILFSFGALGLIAFLIFMISPLIFHGFKTDPMNRSISFGMINYLFIACSDGAILFIPTMVFYWFLATLLVRSEYQRKNFILDN